MPTLIKDIAGWVSRKLARDDVMTDAIEEAGNFYILMTTRVPFPELETKTAERTLTTDVSEYDISDLDDLAGIISNRLTTPSGRTRRLRRSSARKYDSLWRSVQGEPATYARFGLNLEFQPAPSQTGYTYRLRYWKRGVLDDTVGDTELVTPIEWDELIRWETLFRIYYSIGNEEKAMSLVMPTNMPRQAWARKTVSNEVGIIPKLWNDLLLTLRNREQIDEELRIGVRSVPITYGGRLR